jgi:8-oxo-dGTP diphosphatase
MLIKGMPMNPKLYLNVVEVAIEHEGRFLVIKRPEGKHAGGLLDFPGGKVDETDEQNQWDILRAAAKREVLEEVGLDLKDDLTYITSNYFVDGEGLHAIDSAFHCKIVKTELKIQASSREVSEYFWLTPNEIKNAPNGAEWMKKYVQYISWAADRSFATGR